MEYGRMSDEEYLRRLKLVIKGSEGPSETAKKISDGMPTIRFCVSVVAWLGQGNVNRCLCGVVLRGVVGWAINSAKVELVSLCWGDAPVCGLVQIGKKTRMCLRPRAC